MNYENIEINYLELAYISEIDGSKAKEIFQEILGIEKIKRTDVLKVSVLKKHFGSIRSLDPRYDGENKLVFYLKHKSENYKKFLSHLPTIKKKTLIGGKSVLLKIMTPEQLQHFQKIINIKHSQLPTSLQNI